MMSAIRLIYSRTSHLGGKIKRRKPSNGRIVTDTKEVVAQEPPLGYRYSVTIKADIVNVHLMLLYKNIICYLWHHN